jgi:CHAD domain-containing protein
VTPEAVEYLLPDGLDLEELRERLGVALGHAEPARGDVRTFYDTFDGRLHEAGLSLVHADGRVSLGEAGTEAPRRPRRIMAADLPPGPLRDRLADVIDMRAALPVATVRSRRQLLRAVDDEQKTVVRLVIEDASLRNGDALRRRLRVVPVRGYDKALASLRRRIEDDLGLEAATAPLCDEAITRSGGRPDGVSSKLDIALEPDLPADRAAAVVLRRLQEVIADNLPGTLEDVDSEFLHDLRVAVRRTRSLQRELETVFGPAPLTIYRAGFKWLQQVTGPTRDLDVYLLEFDDFRATLPENVRPDLDPLFGLLARRREAERRKMVRALRSDRAEAVLDGWAGVVSGLERAKPPAPAIAGVAGERISKVYRRMVKLGRAIDDDSPHEALHDLRKKGKELRYLLEFFASLYPADVVKPMVKTLKALQDTLGRFQDREVQAAMLRDLRTDVAGIDDGPAALMAMGLLVERLEEQQDEARSEFSERFAAFAALGQRELVKETFG